MDKKLKITLKRSLIGSNERQKRTAESLGLKKLNATVIQQDTPDIRGKIKKLEHLLAVEEI
ncbi:MAG: 50S ribosomal protein L30 [Bacillota bacterium]